MGGIIYKNLCIYKLDLIVLAFMGLITSLTILLSAGSVPEYERESMLMGMYPVLYFFVFFMSTLFEHQIFLADENRTINSFIISTPFGAKGHVEGKYYTILIVNIMMLVWCFITDTIVCLIVNTNAYSMGIVLMLLFCWNLLCSAFSNPFYLRFGTTYGNAARFGALGVIVVVIGVYFLFGDISFLFGDDPLAAIMEFLTGETMILILSLFPAVSVLLYYISCKISVPLYRKGVEEYEQ